MKHYCYVITSTNYIILYDIFIVKKQREQMVILGIVSQVTISGLINWPLTG